MRKLKLNWGVVSRVLVAALPITSSCGLRFQNLTIGECLGQNSADSRNGNIVRRSARTKKAENRISVGVDAPQLTPSKALLGKAVNYGFHVQGWLGDLHSVDSGIWYSHSR